MSVSRQENGATGVLPPVVGHGARDSAAVLLIEDDDGFASLVAEMLTRRGAPVAVRTARDGSQARALLRERSFDLILLDRGLPDGDGLAVLREHAARGGAAPVVLLTADGSARSAVEAIRRVRSSIW
jgi:DNA-binding NtrC family response regulator